MRAPYLLALWLALVLVAPLFAPYDPMDTDTTRTLEAPSADHWLGTDSLGRDVLSRVLYGGQRTLLIAALATAIAVLPGVLFGLLSTFRWLDRSISILVNAVLAFPGLLLALIIMTLLGQGVLPLALATGLAQVAPVARITHSAVLGVLGMGYVEAARGLGAWQGRVTAAHVFPNILPAVLAYMGVVFAYAILNSAALSFLGLGGEPGVPDWGVLLYEGRQAFRLAPWIAAAPGIAITLTVILVNRAASRVK
jgi:peptide/nickel transport system permease protein